VLVRQLPIGWVLVDAQPWGPPWEATMLRWAAVVLLAAAVLALALRDPWDRGPARRAATPTSAAHEPVLRRAARRWGPTAPGPAR
jgi:hypothetical protein